MRESALLLAGKKKNEKKKGDEDNKESEVKKNLLPFPARCATRGLVVLGAAATPGGAKVAVTDAAGCQVGGAEANEQSASPNQHWHHH